MNKKSLTYLLIFTTFLMSCSHLLPIKETESITDYYTRINSECEGEDVVVTLVDGSEHEGEDLMITPEFTTWLNPHSNETINVSTTEVKSITYIDNGYGTGDGAMVGGGILFSLGALLGLASGPINFGGKSSSSFFENVQFAMVVGFICSLPGLLLGSIIGTVIGTETTFKIN